MPPEILFDFGLNRSLVILELVPDRHTARKGSGSLIFIAVTGVKVH
jgi:hypothetical protein